MLEVNKRIEIDGRQYSGYKIKQSILDLETDLIGMVVLYLNSDATVGFIKTHWFIAEEDNDINILIDKVHNLHDKWVI